MTRRSPILCLLAVPLLLVSTASRAQTLIGSIGGASGVLAVNPRANKIYNAANQSVVVHDGFSHASVNVAFPVGVGPQAFALDPIGNRLYVSRTDGQVSLIDGDSNAIISSVPLGSGALAINRNTQRLYVTTGAALSVADLDGNLITSVPNVPGSLMALDPIANRIYVADANSNQITAVNGNDNSAVSAPFNDPVALSVNPVTGLVYAIESSSYKVYEINGSSLAATELMTGDNPLAFGVDPVRNKLYVCNTRTTTDPGSVVAIDLATRAMTTIAVGIRPRAVAINADTNRVYISNSISGSVSVIDGASNSLITSVSLGAGTNAGAITLNPVTNRIYASSTFAGSVAVIDGASYATSTLAPVSVTYPLAPDPIGHRVGAIDGGQLKLVDAGSGAVTPIAVGSGPSSVAFDAAWNRYYVATSTGTVSLVDGATLAVTSIPVGGISQHVAADPARNRAFVANYGSSNVSVIDGATATAVTVATPTQPILIAVDESSGDAFVQHSNVAAITVIRSSTLATETVTLPVRATSLQVNPVTHRVYATTLNTNKLYVIDGASLATTELTLLANTSRLALNRRRNLIYISYQGSDSRITILNGVTHATSTVNLGTAAPTAMVVDEVDDRVFIANHTGFTTFAITVMRGPGNSMLHRSITAATYNLALDRGTGQVYFGQSELGTIRPEAGFAGTPATTINGPPNRRTGSATAAFSFNTSSTYAPGTTSPLGVFFRIGYAGFQPSTALGGGVFSATASGLLPGTHSVSAFAIDALGVTHIGGLSLTSGSLAAAAFPGRASADVVSRVDIVAVPTSTAIGSITPSPSVVGQSYSVPVSVNAASGTPSGSVTVSDGGGGQCTAALSTGSGSCALVGSSAGTKTISANYVGAGPFEPSSAAPVEHEVDPAETVVSISDDTPDPSVRGEAISVTAALAVTPPGAGTPSGTIRIAHAGTYCDIVLPATSCALTPTADGAIVLSADYPGDGNFSASDDTETHHVNALADLAISLDNPADSSVPGTSTSYTVTAINNGPSSVTGVDILASFPAAFDSVGWTCSASSGATCGNASGAGSIATTADLPPGGRVDYVTNAHLHSGATGTVQVDALVDADPTDPLLANNSTGDSNTLTPQADVVVVLAAAAYLRAGLHEPLALDVTNPGPSDAPGVLVQLTFPAISFAATNWTCTGLAGASCPGPGNGAINTSVDLPAGATAQFGIDALMQAEYEGPYALIANASLPPAVTDPQTGNNVAEANGIVDVFGDGFE